MSDNDFIVQKQFRQNPLPTEGWHTAVCAFVQPVGYEKNRYEPDQPPKFKIWFCWELDEMLPTSAGDKAGWPFMQSKKYTKSLDDRSTLYADLKAWKGRALTPSEIAKFDTRVMPGVMCKLLIDHEPRKDGACDTETGQLIKRAVILKIKPADPSSPLMSIRNTEVPKFIMAELATNTGTKMATRPEPMGKDYKSSEPSDGEKIPF